MKMQLAVALIARTTRTHTHIHTHTHTHTHTQLSFPVVGSLNGVHLYASNMKTSLLSCLNGGAKVVWKCFYER